MDVNIILNAIMILFMGGYGFFLKRIISDFDSLKTSTAKYQTDTTKEISEVKLNYLDRFEGLTNKVNETEKTLIKSINESEKNLTKLITEHKGGQ